MIKLIKVITKTAAKRAATLLETIEVFPYSATSFANTSCLASISSPLADKLSRAFTLSSPITVSSVSPNCKNNQGSLIVIRNNISAIFSAGSASATAASYPASPVLPPDKSTTEIPASSIMLLTSIVKSFTARI